MCGIAGEIRFDGQRADLGAIDRACARMASRGPDGNGIWTSGPLALGHRRLSIIDLSPAGNQPMVDADLGLAVVFNGCIYNYRQLRDQLIAKGYRFFSHSDTEVIIKAYAEWGAAAVQRFAGMFAIAIAERDTGRLVLIRDRLGIKPLYLDSSPAKLRFASTLPALVAAGGVDTSIDPVAFSYYMTFHSVVPSPRSILRGIEKLPPATIRTVNPDGSHTDALYWEPAFRRDPDKASWASPQWAEALLDRLRTAVERRMEADVPVGVLLSGGIDSSVVVALLAAAGQHSLQTFSIGFESAGGESGDEFEYSDIVAHEFGTEHHRIEISSSRLLPAIDGAVTAMSEPMVSHDCVAFFLLSQEVSRHVKVVQSGQGADEILGGYDWYPPLAPVERDAAAEAYAKVFFDRRHGPLGELLCDEWFQPEDHPFQFVDRQFSRPGADSALDAALRNDTTVMLIEDPVKRVDNMTMGWGLEARVPFLDHEFVELAAAIPPALKLEQGGKGILKDACRGLVPDAVIDRTKGYFPVPAIRQLEGPYLDRVRQALLSPEAKRRGLFRSGPVERMLKSPNRERTTLGSNALWQLALLEMWLQSHDVG